MAVTVLCTVVVAGWFGLAASGRLGGGPPGTGGLGGIVGQPGNEPGATGQPGGVASPIRGLEGADAATPPAFDPNRWTFIHHGPDESEQANPNASPSAAPLPLDTAAGVDVRVPVAPPARIEVYPSTPSVAPGEPLQLHVSTPAVSYQLTVSRVDASQAGGSQVVAATGQRPGHDYRQLATFDNLTRTARANWPVTDSLATSGWRPGVYIVDAADAGRTNGRAIFVVRTPSLASNAPAFVFTALTYQAYNLWGGANLYSYASPQAIRVSFERPYDQASGRGFWTRYDDRILAWLQRQLPGLQYTTDYDLAIQPPELAPRLLILPQHAEYVPRSLRDWVNRHLNQYGDMSFLSFGANGFYWQVRLATPRSPGAAFDIVCYKNPNADPAAAIAPQLVTTRWRDDPIDQPEGELLGAQYVGILGNAATRYDLTVTAAMPADLLDGTGWAAGTVIHGVLLGEGDGATVAAGGIAVLAGQALDPNGASISPTVTIRTSPARARVFMAGSFAWSDGLPPARVSLGVSATSFERFNRNVLAWLDAAPGVATRP